MYVKRLSFCDIKCSSCNKCNQVCKSFVKESCLRVDRAPYVCNGCDKPLHRCSVSHKYRYDAVFAQRKYEELRTSSRTGVNLTKHQALQMNAVVATSDRTGTVSICNCHQPSGTGHQCENTYNYIEQGVLLTRNIDLKRKVKFKLRKDDSKPSIKNREVFVGRTYADFKQLNPDYFCEMDTVISAKGSNKCILTFYSPETQLFIARLLNRCTEGAVKVAINELERALGTYDFLSVFNT